MSIYKVICVNKENSRDNYTFEEVMKLNVEDVVWIFKKKTPTCYKDLGLYCVDCPLEPSEYIGNYRFLPDMYGPEQLNDEDELIICRFTPLKI